MPFPELAVLRYFTLPCSARAMLRQCRVLSEILHGSHKKPKLGRLATVRREMPGANSHMPLRANALPLPSCGLEKSFQSGMVGSHQGRGMGTVWHV
jgi:hypothetical protein